ncbi:antimicrobial peptide NK-lysin-like [Alosa alosa]|uniref:antimicrobial peptide NK-lysin-like n=1 Tax=Alosa alosa TaxID=278164 RepID=UPI0020151D4D|nr:antimicrobial peptide NK-lysin-like [Alosa alosa]
MGMTVVIIIGYLLIYSVFGSHDSRYEAGSSEKILARDEVQLRGLCGACKWIVKKVRKALPEDADQVEIREQLETVCNKIGLLKSICKKFVKKYMAKLVAEISSADDAKTACVHLKACK